MALEDTTEIKPDAVQAVEPIEPPRQDAAIHGEGSTDAAGSWIKDEHREFAKSYGLNDDDLKDFSSEIEFNRTTRLIDKQIASYAKPQESAEAKPAEVAPATKSEAAPQSAPVSSPKFERIDVEKLKAENYDAETIRLASVQNALIEHLERESAARENERKTFTEQLSDFQQVQQTVKQWQEQQQQAEAQRYQYEFHAAVDSLDDKRFGKVFTEDGRMVSLGKEEDERRRKLHGAFRTVVNHLAETGAQIPPVNVLMKRARQIAFAEDIAAEERRKYQEELAAQSKKIRPVAARAPNGQFAPTDQPLTRAEEARRIANDPEVVSKWNQLQRASGAVV